MPGSIDEAVKQLRKLFAQQFELQEELDRLSDVTTTAEADAKLEVYNEQIKAKKREIWGYLVNEVLRYPPYHYRNHSEELKKFHEIAPYDKSVFLMTKFPEGNDPKDLALRAIIDAVKAAIKEAGMTPRIATFGYHDWLWQNVELYLVGCGRGVAIVEDHYRSEMNPNVALEWGWMKGMGKKVFFLMEESFANERADWKGLISKTFAWDSPTESIRTAISAWLKDKEEV